MRSLDFCCCTREENGLTVLKGVCESPRLGLAETLNLCGDAQQPGLPVEARHVVRKVPAERMFKVKLQKLADGFGLKYDASDSNVLLVQRVTDGGAASQWNQTAQPKIQPYDRVVEVGKFGLMSSSEMLKAIDAASGLVELGFERPQLKEFSVRRFGQKLGLILQKLKSQTVLRSLPVKSLEANGVLMKKNLADAETYLKSHDRIIQVNGECGSLEAMLQQLLEDTITFKCYQYAI